MRRENVTVVAALVIFGGVIWIVQTLPNLTKETLLLTVGYLVVYFSLLYNDMATLRNSVVEQTGAVERLIAWLSTFRNAGRAAKKRELYPAMTLALTHLHDHAYVTYADHRSPSVKKNEFELLYHRKLSETIRTHSDVEFRRVIALFPDDTPDKRMWVREELALASEVENYKVRMVEVADKRLLPHPVQIFDTYVFLIDPNRSDEDVAPRDVHLLDADIAEIYRRYYEKYFDDLPTTIPATIYEAAAPMFIADSETGVAPSSVLPVAIPSVAPVREELLDH